ncbi:MAG: NifU family protein, partial [Thermodesulfobacteriota bacterium]
RVRADMAREQNPDQEQGDDFASLSVVKKIRAIEKVLDTDIRPVLARDGGGIELDDLECKDDGTCVISVQYKGACKGCAGSVAGTLGFVQQTLQDKLSPYIQVKVA